MSIFTARGPGGAGFRTDEQGLTEFDKLEFGVEATGKLCGVAGFSESSGNGSSDSPGGGVGVFGRGRLVGVQGFSQAGIAGFFRSEGSDATIIGFKSPPEPLLPNLGEELRSSSVGVLGISTEGPGAAGSSADGPGVQGNSGNGPGVNGFSNNGPGMRGGSNAGEGGVFESNLNVGVQGTNHQGESPGVRGVNKTGTGFGGVFISGGSGSRGSGGGVLGVGGNGPGGSFESTSGPQIHLTPISELPRGGKAGDIAAVKSGGADVQLFFCIRSRGQRATWAPVQLGSPIVVG
jgi:hypothetical protein